MVNDTNSKNHQEWVADQKLKYVLSDAILKFLICECA